MRLSNSFRSFARIWDHFLGGPSHSRQTRLSVEGLGDRTVPSAVAGTASVVTVERICDAVEGGDAGLFRFTRTGDTADALTIDVSYGGNATIDSDYRLDSAIDHVTFQP